MRGLKDCSPAPLGRRIAEAAPALHIRHNSAPIRIELAEHSPGDKSSGIGRYTRELYDQLSRHSEHVAVRLTTTIPPPLSGRLPVLRHLPLGVNDHQAGSIVHFMQIMGCAQMLWRPVRPAVATAHDLGVLVWRERLPLKRQIGRMLFLLSLAGLRRMDAIIAVSGFTRRSVIEHLRVPAERVHTVHAGIDLALFRPVPQARRQLARRYPLPGGAQARYVLYVGSELSRKNLGTLLRALALIVREQPDIYLLKVGRAGGEQARADTLRLITGLGLTDHVHFFEGVPDGDLPLFYSAADVYVCPSLLEGFGLPVLEAMACGTPVVCSNVTALPEIAGDAALLVAPTDADGFAGAVLRLLDDADLRARMITRGRERAALFSWQRTVEGVLQVYQRLACGAGCSPA